jgi:uncharacterized protein YqjF (DUF2071 family)
VADECANLRDDRGTAWRLFLQPRRGKPDGGRRRAIAAAPGSLEYFLTERYCLYNVDTRFRAYRLDIHHVPWTLQRAEAAIERNTMAEAAGIRLPSMAPLLHFSARQDMLAWAPETLEPARAS